MPHFLPHINALSPYVPGEQPRDLRYVKLNTNENPYPPSPRVAEAIERAVRDGLARYPEPLATSFREQAARVHGVSPEAILAGNGSDDVLTIITRAFVGAGDRVRYPYPGYLLYSTLAELQNAVPEPISWDADWRVPAALSATSERVRLVFFPNPNSPTGLAYPKGALRDLAATLRVPLVIDEAYADFADDHCLELARDCENVIVTRSLSKSYSLAGLRFGYAVAAPPLIAGLRKVKDSYNCDALSIAAAAAALEDQAWMRDNVAKVVRTRGRLAVAMRDLGFAVPDSQANFVWCTRSDRPVKPIYEELKRRGILVRYISYPGWGDGLRISVGNDGETDQLVDAMRAIV